MAKTELQTKLDEAIPVEAIEQRQGGGKQLSYLSGAYVINRLNQVLGQGAWGYEIKELTKVFEGTVNQRSGDVHSVSYIAQVSLYAKLREDKDDKHSLWGTENFTEVGYGDGTDKANPGKAHELAVKEAVTDGLKRAAKNLGMSLGLQLYFKEGQYVGEANTEVDRQSTASGDQVSSKNNTDDDRRDMEPSKPNAATVKKTIKSAFAVLSGQKQITKEEFLAQYTQGVKVDDLDDATSLLILNKIKTNFPKLGL